MLEWCSRHRQSEGGPPLAPTPAAGPLPHLEQLFGSQRYHERRATGRRAASPAAVLRGEVRLIAATATRLRPPTVTDLGRVSRDGWRELRRRLERRRQARTLRTRFRRDPTAFLTALERLACQ